MGFNPRRKYYTNAEIDSMKEDYSVPEGMKTLRQLADEHAIKLHTLDRRVEMLGLNADGYRGSNERCFNAEHCEQIINFNIFPDGYIPTMEVARIYGLSQQVVKNRARLLEITPYQYKRWKLFTPAQAERIAKFDYKKYRKGWVFAK